MDIDEDAFRKGQVTTKLCGYLKYSRRKTGWGLKSGGAEGEASAIASIASYVIDSMEKDCLYIIEAWRPPPEPLWSS